MWRAAAFHQPRGAIHVIGGHSVVKCLNLQAIFFAPLAGADVQFGYICPLLLQSLALAQKAGKEMVIAVPTPLVVQWDDKQVGAFEIFQRLLPGGGGIHRHGVTQRPTQAVEDGGL